MEVATVVRGFGLVVSMLAACSASAGVITVLSNSTVTQDGSTCTLAQAIHAANTANNAYYTTTIPSGSATTSAGTCGSSATLGANTIVFTGGLPRTQTFSTADNWWYGPNALPPIASDITIDGGSTGLTLQVPSATTRLRFFFVGANSTGPLNGLASPGPGKLTLKRLTLSGGVAKGGGFYYGGGGAGMGGAIFNQGVLVLDSTTLANNTAQGGSFNGSLAAEGGGGIGQDAAPGSPYGVDAGGFGGSLGGGSYGGNGGSSGGAYGGGSGGGGFVAGSNGSTADEIHGSGGNGGGLGGTGGNGINFYTAGLGGDGGGGGAAPLGGLGAAGGRFGYGGSGSGSSGGYSGGAGGGGIGGGGGGCITGFAYSGGAGFGGGGGGTSLGTNYGQGGFGGGGASSAGNSGAGGGFGGGGGGLSGGGGAGMGGAVFNHLGSVRFVNVTASGNRAIGGARWDYAGSNATNGSGLGAVLFNLNGQVTIDFSTLSGNTVTNTNGAAAGAGDGSVYSLAYGNDIINGNATSATLTINNSIVYSTAGSGSAGNHDVVSFVVGGSNAANTGNGAALNFVGTDLVGSVSLPSVSAPLTSTQSGSSTSVNPNLNALADNGGPAWTMLPAPSSFAVDRANCTMANNTTLTVDQRGAARPQGALCEIGAAEVIAAPNYNLAGSPASLDIRQGSSLIDTVMAITLDGLSSTVALAATGLPSGVIASFSPPSVTPTANGTGTSMLTLTAAVNAPITALPVTVTITGTSGASTRNTTIGLKVKDVIFANGLQIDYDPAGCSAVAGTLDISWYYTNNGCSGIENTDGNPAQAKAAGAFSMSGMSVTNDQCIGTAAYAFTLSPDKKTLSGGDTLAKVPMTLTLSHDGACFTGHWISGPDDYISTIWNFAK